jgi:hypothetical protein
VEEWRRVIGFGSYKVSNKGRVKGPRRILTPVLTKYGYHQVTICHSGKRYTRFVHRLVADAFIGPAPTEAHDVAHNDGVRTNNVATNIRWATPKENNADKHKHGTAQIGSKNGCSRLTEMEVGEILYYADRGYSQKMLALIYGVSRRNINKIVNGKSWGHI